VEQDSQGIPVCHNAPLSPSQDGRVDLSTLSLPPKDDIHRPAFEVIRSASLKLPDELHSRVTEPLPDDPVGNIALRAQQSLAHDGTPDGLCVYTVQAALT
jgi:hypothetical protein